MTNKSKLVYFFVAVILACATGHSMRHGDILIIEKSDPDFDAYRLLVRFASKTCFQWKTTCKPMPRCGDKQGFPEDMKRSDCVKSRKFEEIVSAEYIEGQAFSDDLRMLVFFVPKGKSICRKLPDSLASDLVGTDGADNIFASLMHVCMPQTEIDHSVGLREQIQRYNESVHEEDPYPVNGFMMIMNRDRPRDLYIDVVCSSGKEGFVRSETGLEQFIEWAKMNDFDTLWLSSIPYVMPYYQRLKFKVDSNDPKDQIIPQPPQGQKAWCYGYPELDPNFEEYMQRLGVKGIGSVCDAEEAKLCYNTKDSKRKGECETFFSKCYANGFRTRLKLNREQEK